MHLHPPIHPLEAQRLAGVEQQLGSLPVSPAEYEVIRRVVAVTGDFEFSQSLHFSSDALKSGAAALAARSTILVDIPAVQVAAMPTIQASFANPTYCCLDAITRPQRTKTATAWGLEVLAPRYPNAVVVVGQTPSTLVTLGELIQNKVIYPALVIATPPHLQMVDHLNETNLASAPMGPVLELLQRVGVPYVGVSGQKGNAMVAIAILTALIEMTWQAYGQDPRTGIISR